MDLLNAGRVEKMVEKVNELSSAVLADSRRRARLTQKEPGKSAYLGLSPTELREYSVPRAIRSQLPNTSGLKVTDGLERECHNQLAQRFDLELGSIAIPTDVLERRTLTSKILVGVSAPAGLTFIDLLRSSSLVYRLGARRLTDLQNDVAIPRQTAGTSVTWLGPGGTVTASDPAFGQVSATPKIACIITELSEQLLRQSAAEEVIAHSLAADMAVGLDQAAIRGIGGVEPLGILNTPGIGTASGSSLGYSGLVGVQKTVADANGVIDPRAVGYITTPAVGELLKLRPRFTATDSPLWKGSLAQGEIEGVQAIASTIVPTATLIYGDFSQVVIGEWGPLLISTDRSDSRFNQAQIGIRALWMVDVFVTAPAAFVKVTSIT